MIRYKKTSSDIISKFHISNPIFLYSVLIFLSIICVFPLYLALVNGTRSDSSLMQHPFSLFPSTHTLENHKILLQGGYNIWNSFLNSVYVTVPYTIISAYFSSLAGYAFAKHKFKGREILFYTILLTIMIPTQLGFIGYFDLMDRFNLIDTFYPLILPAFHNGAFIFFTKQYIETSVHDEIIEAARMDGSSDIKIFHTLVFPLATPAIATMSIFTFVSQWNNLLSPMIILINEENFTVPIFIAKLRDPTLGTHYGAIYLALGLSIIPLIIVFTILSKYIIKGNNIGAVKG